jgi:hypothetical protein
MHLRDGNLETLRRACYVLFGTVLLWAAVAKAVFVAPLPREGLLRTPWALSAVVLLEIVAAAWFFFVAPSQPTLTRRLGIGLFLMLAAVSLNAWARGEACNCFGTSRISPAFTFGFDLLAAMALWVFSAGPNVVSAPRVAYQGPGIMACLLGLPLAAWTVSQSPAHVGGGDLLDEAANFVVLEPETWIGKPLPIMPFIEIDAELGHGKWLVVLYRPDCAHCQRIVPVLRGKFAEFNDGQRLALIDLSGVTESRPIASSPIVVGRLPPTKQWFVTPPVGAYLVAGNVLQILSESDLMQFFLK